MTKATLLIFLPFLAAVSGEFDLCSKKHLEDNPVICPVKCAPVFEHCQKKDGSINCFGTMSCGAYCLEAAQAMCGDPHDKATTKNLVDVVATGTDLCAEKHLGINSCDERCKSLRKQCTNAEGKLDCWSTVACADECITAYQVGCGDPSKGGSRRRAGAAISTRKQHTGHKTASVRTGAKHAEHKK